MKFKKTTFLFAVNNANELSEIKKITCTIFGGYSLTQMLGGWTDEETNQVLEETSYKIEIISGKDYKYFDNLAQHICKIANQKEVYHYTDNIVLTKIKQK